MTPGLALNTASAHTWAAVVSSTAWKRHTLEDGGTLTAEYMRSPLILWGTRPGEGEVLAPAGPSALEDYFNKQKQIRAYLDAPIFKVKYYSRFYGMWHNRKQTTFVVTLDSMFPVVRFAITACGKYFLNMVYGKGHQVKQVQSENLQDAYCQILFAIRNSQERRTYDLASLLIFLILAAFRAHLTRRVKPTPRRHRIRRPLYARPRPPSAPLAPPAS